MSNTPCQVPLDMTIHFQFSLCLFYQFLLVVVVCGARRFIAQFPTLLGMKRDLRGELILLSVITSPRMLLTVQSQLVSIISDVFFSYLLLLNAGGILGRLHLHCYLQLVVHFWVFFYWMMRRRGNGGGVDGDECPGGWNH